MASDRAVEPEPEPVESARSTTLDHLRAIAIALMILDHVLIVTGHENSLWRLTLTRLSMPLFFLVSGHLLRRRNWFRLGVVVAIGVALPEVVPWLDAPNVLIWYAVGAVLLTRAPRWFCAAVIAAALALAANDYPSVSPSGYAPEGLLALMALGRLVPRRSIPDLPLPRRLAVAGRYPLSTFVGHIAVLEALRRLG